MTTVKVIQFGDSAGIVLPKDVLDRLRVDQGDTLEIVETPNGVELVPSGEDAASQIKVAGEVMREDQDVLRKFAE